MVARTRIIVTLYVYCINRLIHLMLNVTADGTNVVAAERFNGQNLYSYVTTSVHSEIVIALPMKPDRESELYLS